ncbi:MAG: hypothetical protein IKN96_07175 [Oscillibacter sp.]|nr:hypothetical protein [Oscillibacter sp.]
MAEWKNRKALRRRVREVIRAYPSMGAADAPERRAEYKAVRDALRAAERLPDGYWRVRLVRLALMGDRRTIDGAALECHVSPRTARNWNGAFILAVAKNLNWI